MEYTKYTRIGPILSYAGSSRVMTFAYSEADERRPDYFLRRAKGPTQAEAASTFTVHETVGRTWLNI